MLVAKRINKRYGNVQVLRNVDLTIAQKEVVAIVGASGAGKSTLLHILSTLDKPDDGLLQLDGTDLLALHGKKLASFRNRSIGFVFQSYNLLPEFTTLENVCMPGYIRGENKSEVEVRGKHLLQLLHLSTRQINQYPTTLSGGEQQRVAVARALINKPQIVFADEPSGNLDTHTAKALHELIFALRDNMGQTFLIATHNQTLASKADRRLYIEAGSLTIS